LERLGCDSDTEDEDCVIVWYLCLTCVAVEKGITETEALDWIRAKRQDLKKKMERTAEWERAKANPLTSFEFADSSKAQKRVIMRRQVVDIFRPSAKAIILKQAQMIERAEHGALHKQLCEELKAERDLAKIEILLEKIDDAENSFVAACQPLAFADRAKSRDELFRWQMEADYADGWTEVKSSSGRLIGGFSAFYICRAGPADGKCNTLILNKEWARRHTDILATGQRWKCRCCGAKYWTKFGMVVDVRLVGGGASLSLAPCTDGDDKDLHALILQDQFPQAQTPDELYDFIPTVVPQESAFLRKAVAADFWNGEATGFGVYKLINFDNFLSLPNWDWKIVANFFGESDLFEMALKVGDGEVVES
jgi:hypothetical protein